MIRNLKLLGLALAAIFTLGAMGASAASAYQATYTLEKGVESANLTGTGLAGSKAHQITLGQNGLTCSIAKFEGKISGPTTQITLSPIFESCTATVAGIGEGVPATITMNGCYFIYSINAGGAAEEDEYAGTLHIHCAEGKQIEVHLFGSLAQHSENKPTCTYGVEEQTLTENVHITNDTESKDVTLSHSSLVKVKRLAGTVIPCGAASQEGLYHGTTTVTAKTTGIGNPVGFHVG